MSTEIRVAMNHQFRAIRWAGDNYDEVCVVLGFKPKRSKSENLQVGLYGSDARVGDYIVMNTGLQVLTPEKFNQTYTVVEENNHGS